MSLNQIPKQFGIAVALSCFTLMCDASAEQSKAIVPLVDGMTIRTSNSVANVEVRAKSLGPGLCAVTVSTQGGQANFLAPPHDFSPWTVLASHLGEAVFTISFAIGCDTGIVGQVRYYKR